MGSTPPTLLIMTGPPGTGKSTLAESAAGAMRASVLGWDWVMAAMTPFDEIQAALRTLSHERHRAVGWSILWNLTTAQLRSGRSVVVDGVARQPDVDQGRAVARGAAAHAVVVVASCSDEALHRGRVEGRTRGIPGWHELDWDHVVGVLRRWDAPVGADLYLDAADPLEANVERLLSLLAASA